MLLTEQCRNVVLFVLGWRAKPELCYHVQLDRQWEAERAAFGPFLILSQSKRSLTLLSFLLIKLLGKGAGLTGPRLAGGGTESMSRGWAGDIYGPNSSHCFLPLPPSPFRPATSASVTCVVRKNATREKTEAATKSAPPHPTPQHTPFQTSKTIQPMRITHHCMCRVWTLPRFHR